MWATVAPARGRSRSALEHPRCPGGLLVRSYDVSVRMDNDSRWTVGFSGQVERVGHLVETNDRADARERIETPGCDGVQRPVPVLRVRAAAELDGDALTGGIGDVQRITAVPPAGAVDAGAHVDGFHDLLDQPCGTHAFEDDERTP